MAGADTTAKAYSTIGTILKCAGTQLCKIKTYPQLGGSPDQLETTDLEDEMQTFVDGVQKMDTMEFKANYTPEAYDAVQAAKPASGSVKDYELDFGSSGGNGVFKWSGTHSVYVNEGEVNGIREMTIVCTPSTKITKGTAGA